MTTSEHCTWGSGCCRRHPRLSSCLRGNTTVAVVLPEVPDQMVVEDPFPAMTRPVGKARLLLSATVAAATPAWFVHAAAANWLRFTMGGTRIVLHMDRARPVNFSLITAAQARSSEERRNGAAAAELNASVAVHQTALREWLWLLQGAARVRVSVNPLRIPTARRTGSILVAHLHNFLFASRHTHSRPSAAWSHFVFLAVNTFFVRTGIELYVSQRHASLASTACPQPPIRVNRHHCTRERWFGSLNGFRSVGTRSLVEGDLTRDTNPLRGRVREGCICTRDDAEDVEDADSEASPEIPCRPSPDPTCLPTPCPAVARSLLPHPLSKRGFLIWQVTSTPSPF